MIGLGVKFRQLIVQAAVDTFVPGLHEVRE